MLIVVHCGVMGLFLTERCSLCTVKYSELNFFLFFFQLSEPAGVQDLRADCEWYCHTIIDHTICHIIHKAMPDLKSVSGPG